MTKHDLHLSVRGVAVAPALPDRLRYLTKRLHERSAEVLRSTNPDAVRSALRRGIRMLRQLLKEEHGLEVDRIEVLLQDGAGGPVERVTDPP